MKYDSIEELVQEATKANKSLAQYILEDQARVMETSEEALILTMQK